MSSSHPAQPLLTQASHHEMPPMPSIPPMPPSASMVDQLYHCNQQMAPFMSPMMPGAVYFNPYNPMPPMPLPLPTPSMSMMTNVSPLSPSAFPIQATVSKPIDEELSSHLEAMALEPDTRSVSASFLNSYYNALHLGNSALCKYYSVDAQITWPSTDGPVTVTGASHLVQLKALRGIVSVNIGSIVHQKSLYNSILIKAAGSMQFESSKKEFQQTFFISKSMDNFWLIHNDVLEFATSKAVIVSEPFDVDQECESEERPLLPKISPIPNGFKRHLHGKSYPSPHPPNANNPVNKRMVNKFYHDGSYQRFDNSLAIFIRNVPDNLTHSKLCGVLRAALNRYAPSADIIIDYIDVNYHKQFAFVYFGNPSSFQVAIDMQKFTVNGYVCEIQRKHSGNGPRKVFPRKQRPNCDRNYHRSE